LSLDMLQSEPAAQIGIASFTAVLTLVFLIMIARLFLAPLNALAISGVFWFGTSLASTLGTALWSHNFATLFALIAIYSSLKAAKDGCINQWPTIAIFLFFAYLCRPTMALLAPFVLLFLFTYDKTAAFKSASLLAALLGCFVGFSIHEFNQFLPDYYMPQRLSGGHFPEALYGNLLSPARGLLIFSPFILLAWTCFGVSTKEFKLKVSWLLIGIAWPAMHLIFVSRFPHWWGGHSFGARFMTDVLPGLFLLTIRTWPVAIKSLYSTSAIVLLVIASAFSIYVNSYQGLFNMYTAQWNAEPNIDKFPENIFDWEYPQFMHNKERHASRLIQRGLKFLPSISPDEVFSHTSDKVIFIDWWGAESTHRWSSGKSAKIVFVLNDQERANFKGGVSMSAGTLGNQRLGIYLNGHKIYGGQLDAWHTVLDIAFDPSLLKAGGNSLRFDLPDARQPGTSDPRVLALALRSFSLH